MFSEKLYKLLTTLSLIVILVGIVSTEYYYIQFGIKYQFLDIPFFHIIYRGITSIYSAWHLFFIYLIIGIWLSFNENSTIKKKSKIYKFFKYSSNKIVSIILIFLMIIVTFPIAKKIGISQAMKDLNYDSCTLPELLSLEIDSKEQLDFGQNYRLLNMSKDFIIYFKLEENDNPNFTKIPTFWINKSNVNKIKLRQ